MLTENLLRELIDAANGRSPLEPFSSLEPIDWPDDPVARLTATPEKSETVTPIQTEPFSLDPMTSTREERQQGQETFEQSTPGSPAAFQAAQAATGVSKRWFKQENGRIPLDRMKQVGAGHYLKPNAGRAFLAMLRAAKKDGVNIAWTDTYRDYDTQVKTKQAKGDYAAEPGTSKHGWGIAVDFNVNDPKVKAWLDKNGKKFGWVNPGWAHDGEGIEEPWHWEFQGGWKGRTPTTKKKPNPRLKMTSPDPLNKLDGPSSLNSAPIVFGKIMDEFTQPQTRGFDSPQERGPRKLKGVKGQLYAGFMEAGRPDLAKMVFTKAFDVWIGAESGWDRNVVSPANNHGMPNGGLFQFWYGHDWAQKYFKNGKFTANPYQQAIFAATHFDLNPEDIRTYAQQIANGTYEGWG